jgi:TPP-dependent pyruvate/acetoin dehydrogenase alpha subunit
VCENNLYSEFSDSRRMARVASIAARMAAYGIDAAEVDGNDVEAVHAAAAAAVAACRAGDGPVLLEAFTYRWHGHYEGDGQPYKPPEEVAEWKARDPLEIASATMLEAGTATGSELERIREHAKATVEEAVAAARAAAPPDPEEAYAHVLVG